MPKVKVDVDVRERRASVSSIVSRSKDVGTEKSRETWDGTLEFVLSCIGYAVGLGNLTRFPYICGRNGGATFMIPYLIMMTFAGLPMFYLELAIGQYSKVSPALLYRRMVPIFSGVFFALFNVKVTHVGLGPAMVMITIYTSIYYNVYMAWALHYIYDCIEGAINTRLPFVGCHKWASEYCLDPDVYRNCSGKCTLPPGVENSDCQNITEYIHRKENVYWNGIHPNGSVQNNVGRARCYNSTKEGWSEAELEHRLEISKELYYGVEINEYKTKHENAGCVSAGNYCIVARPPTTEYNDYLLGHPINKELMSVWNWPKWDLVVSLALAWLLIFGVLIKGVHSAGKVVYFTATFPYVLLTILLIRGNLLESSIEGIKFYMVPKPDKLLEIQPWTDAATQIFFSLSVGGGGLTTLATYNSFDTNLLRDTQIVVFGNCATSLFAGFVIFPILGYEAVRTYPHLKPEFAVAILARGGPSLAFTSYPAALVEISPGWLWSLLFFFMLILLGVDSENVMVEVVITMIVDCFPMLKSNWRIKAVTTFTVCFIGFLAGLVFLTPSGIELINLFDTFAGGWSLLIVCVCEVIMVSWIYGLRRFIADIECMLGMPPNALWRICGYPSNIYWWICWAAITPMLLLFILGFSFAHYSLKYAGRSYPRVWEDTGFVICFSSVALIPILAVYILIMKVIHHHPWNWLVKPNEHWGPPDATTREHILTTHPYYNGRVRYGGFTKDTAYGDNVMSFQNGAAPPLYDGVSESIKVISIKHHVEKP